MLLKLREGLDYNGGNSRLDWIVLLVWMRFTDRNSIAKYQNIFIS